MGGDGVHHVHLIGVDDGQRQSRRHGLGQEGAGHQRAVGQTEGDVRHTQHRGQPQLIRHPADGLQRGLGLILLGGDRQCQAVDPEVTLRDAVGLRRSQDVLRNGDALVGGLGQPLFIHRQSNDGRAVLLHDGQDAVQYILVPVDGVHRSLAAADTQSRLEGVGVGGVQHQGQIGGLLELAHHLGQHGHLVHAGIADVDVQDVRARVLLLDGDVNNIVEVLFLQRLLEALLAGGIDALADDPHTGNADGLGRGADDAVAADFASPRRRAADALMQRANVFRIGAAAAAHDGHARLDGFCHGFGEGSRGQVIMTIRRVGQARVGLGDDGQVGVCKDLPQRGQQLRRAQGAVHADGVRTQAGQCRGHGSRCAAGEGAPGFLKAHRHDDGEGAVFLRSDQGGAGLLQVGHGLDGDEVSPGLHARADDLGEHIHCRLKGEGAQRLQQLAQGTDVQSDLRAGACTGLLCRLDGAQDGLLHGRAVGSQLAAVRAEGVGVDDVRPGGHILPVDVRQQAGIGQGQQLRRLARLHSRPLEHGAHRAVEEGEGRCIKHGCASQFMECYHYTWLRGICTVFPLYEKRPLRAASKTPQSACADSSPMKGSLRN